MSFAALIHRTPVNAPTTATEGEIRRGNWDDRRPEEYHENTLLMVGGKLVKDEKRNGYIWLEDAGRIAACDVVADSGKRH